MNRSLVQFAHVGVMIAEIRALVESWVLHLFCFVFAQKEGSTRMIFLQSIGINCRHTPNRANPYIFKFRC